MLCVREDIPSNLLNVESLPIEGFYVELKLRSYEKLRKLFL